MNTGMGSLRLPRMPVTRLTVRTESLDAWRREIGMPHADLVKLDIEGAEALALRGMTEGLTRGEYKMLMIELHPTELPAFGSSVESIIGLLKSFGYRILYWNNAGWFVDSPVPEEFNYILALAPGVAVARELRPDPRRPDAGCPTRTAC